VVGWCCSSACLVLVLAAGDGGVSGVCGGAAASAAGAGGGTDPAGGTPGGGPPGPRCAPTPPGRPAVPSPVPHPASNHPSMYPSATRLVFFENDIGNTPVPSGAESHGYPAAPPLLRVTVEKYVLHVSGVGAHVSAVNAPRMIETGTCPFRRAPRFSAPSGRAMWFYY
jgi:hypothetical protein